MKFKADEISSVIQREIEQFSPEVTTSEVGQVLEVGDGIARVYGLSGLMSGEMVTFENGVKGIALNLEESSVGVMVLGDYTRSKKETPSRRPARCSGCRSARRSSAAWSTPWASRSTSRDRS